MKIKFLTILLLFVCSCSIDDSSENAVAFYEETMNMKLPADISGFTGEAKSTFPLFMSWGIYNYTCNTHYINSLLDFDNFSEQNGFNQKFQRINVKYFTQDDISFFTKQAKGTYKTAFDTAKCIYLNGINFPYSHELLIDTTTFETLHIVSGTR